MRFITFENLSEIKIDCFFSLIFWTNHLTSAVIERSLIDGNDRKLIIASELEEVKSLVVDHKDDLLFWADSRLKKIESSTINGENRKIIIGNIEGSTIIAVNGMDLFWTDTENHIILRTHKLTGHGREEVKSQALHLTGLLGVLPKPDVNNPCAVLNCSHICLVDSKKNQASCSCPKGNGMVLSSDKETCGYPPTCKPSEFTCTSGIPACLPLQWRCDGQSECSDHSDEIGCPECEAKHFK
jgi:low density lipoprotein receptor-related protein 5/6